MAVLIVGSETDLAGLRHRLFRGRPTKKSQQTAFAAMRKANPGIDFDRLKPGTVLVLPEIPEIHAPDEVSTGSVIGDSLSDIVGRLGDAVGETESGAAEAAKRSKAEQRRLTGLLKREEVRAASEKNPRLAEALAAAEAAIATRAETEKASATANKRAFRQWAGELDALRGLLPD